MAQAIVIDNAGNEEISAQVQSQVTPQVQGQSQSTLIRTNHGQTIFTTLQRLLDLQ